MSHHHIDNDTPEKIKCCNRPSDLSKIQVAMTTSDLTAERRKTLLHDNHVDSEEEFLPENFTKQVQEIKKNYEINTGECEKIWKKCNSSLTNIKSFYQKPLLEGGLQKSEIDMLLKYVEDFKIQQDSMKQCEGKLIEILETKSEQMQELYQADQQQKKEIIKLSCLLQEMSNQLENDKYSGKKVIEISPFEFEEIGMYKMKKENNFQLQVAYSIPEQPVHGKPKITEDVNDSIQALQQELQETKSKLTNYENLVMCIKKNLRHLEPKTLWIEWISNYLINAAENGQTDFITFLLYLGAEINSKRQDGTTALRAAVLNGQVDVIIELLNHGVDIDCMDNEGYTTLHWAADKGHLNLVSKLISVGADVNAKSKTHCTPLHCAAGSGHVNILNELLTHGADINSKMEDNMTPLHLAVRGGHLSITHDLILRGADINCTNENRETPLHLAADKGCLLIVNQLISKGAEVNCKCKGNITPLHRTAANGNIHILNELLWNGADVNCKSENNMTPLHYASQNGHLDLINELVKRGGDISVKNNAGQSALDFAEKSNLPKVVDTIKKYSIVL